MSLAVDRDVDEAPDARDLTVDECRRIREGNESELFEAVGEHSLVFGGARETVEWVCVACGRRRPARQCFRFVVCGRGCGK